MSERKFVRKITHQVEPLLSSSDERWRIGLAGKPDYSVMREGMPTHTSVIDAVKEFEEKVALHGGMRGDLVIVSSWYWMFHFWDILAEEKAE